MSEFDDALSHIGNIVGNIGGQVLNAINLAGAIQSGNLPRYLSERAQLGQDPAARTQMDRSGFYSGLAGYGPPSLAPDPNVQSAGYGNQGQLIGPTVNTALPPLTAQAQAEQQKQQFQANLYQRAATDPQAAAMLGMPLSPEQQQAMTRQYGVGRAGGPTKMVFGPKGPVETYGETGVDARALNPGDDLIIEHGMYFIQKPDGSKHFLRVAPKPGVDPNAGLVDDGGMPTGGTTTPTAPSRDPNTPEAQASIRAALDEAVAKGGMTPQERDEALATQQNNPAFNAVQFPSTAPPQAPAVAAPQPQPPSVPTATAPAPMAVAPPVAAPPVKPPVAPPGLTYGPKAFTEGVTMPTREAMIAGGVDPRRFTSADVQAGRKAVADAKQEQLKSTLLAKNDALSAPTKTMIEAAPSVKYLSGRVKKALEMVQAGPLASRFHELSTGEIGTDDPAWVHYRFQLGLLTSQLVKMHFGSRGGQMFLQEFQKQLNIAYTPNDMRAALEDLDSYADELLSRKSGGSPAPTAPAGSLTPGPVQGMDGVEYLGPVQ
jgi:hypothetical protein